MENLTYDDMLNALFTKATAKGRTHTGKSPKEVGMASVGSVSEISVAIKDSSWSMKVFYTETNAACFYLPIPDDSVMDITKLLVDRKVKNPFAIDVEVAPVEADAEVLVPKIIEPSIPETTGVETWNDTIEDNVPRVDEDKELFLEAYKLCFKKEFKEGKFGASDLEDKLEIKGGRLQSLMGKEEILSGVARNKLKKFIKNNG